MKSAIVLLFVVLACGGEAITTEEAELTTVIYEEPALEEPETLELEEESEELELCEPGAVQRLSRDHMATCNDDGFWVVNIKCPSPQGSGNPQPCSGARS